MIKIGYLLNLIRVRTRRLIERAAANAAADAIREAGAQGKKALEAAEAEATPVTELFRNASGDEAVELAAQLQASEEAVLEAKKRTGEKIVLLRTATAPMPQKASCSAFRWRRPPWAPIRSTRDELLKHT